MTRSNLVPQNLWALLIGVDEYVDAAIPKLSVCSSDVQAVYDLLIAHNHTHERVKLVRSPDSTHTLATRAEILTQLFSVAQAAAEDDLLLFYFSGHGIARDGRAYLLPSDTRYTALADTAIDLNRVKEIIQESAARAKVIILDACHSGAQIGKASPGMTEDFMRRVFQEAEGLVTLASCKQDQVSWEWTEQGRSVFTHFFLQGLSGQADFEAKGFVTVSDMGRYLTDRVKMWAVKHNRVQTPTLQCAVAGDIVLLTYLSPAMQDAKSYYADSRPRDSSVIVNGASAVRKAEALSAPKNHGSPTITWLHLSDFHFRTDNTYSSNVVLEALLHDIAEQVQVQGLQPNFIVISGDLAFSGQPAEYALARKFLNRLLETTRLTTEHLFLVPGNHDVDRGVISPLAAGVARLLDNRDAVHALQENRNDCALTFQRFHAYREFTAAYLGEDTLFDNNYCSYVKQLRIADSQVAILGLNSAWLSSNDRDRNQLILSERPVRKALHIAQNADIRLAVMHHPFDWLRDFDRDDVEALLRNECDYILHGHMHQLGLLQAQGPDGGAMVIAAGACYQGREHPNSYNFVQLDLGGKKGTVHLRTYSDQKGGFWTKDVTSYRNVKEGTYTFDLPDNYLARRISLPPTISSPTPPLLRNPFICGSPTRPADFVNRQDTLRTVFNRLYNGESTAIVGEPHIGKTSLLLKLTDEHVQRAYLVDRAPNTLISYHDLHPVDSPDTFWEQSLEPLWEHPDHWLTPRHWKSITESGYTPSSLRRIFRHLGRNGRRLVLLLDEFERLVVHPNFQSPDFFALLRSLASVTDGLALVTASRQSVGEMNERARELLEIGSPFFNIMIDEHLRPFDERSVNDLLDRAGEKFSLEERLFVRRVAGRNPYLLQAMAASLFETTGEGRCSRAAKNFYHRVASHFDDVWNTMHDRTRTACILLGLVELGGMALGETFKIKEIEEHEIFNSELRNMINKGLVEKVEDDWPFEHEPIMQCRGRPYVMGAHALTWWIRDVVVTEARPVTAYKEWLSNRAYRGFLTQEQWDRLLNGVRTASNRTASDVGVIAREIFEAIARS